MKQTILNTAKVRVLLGEIHLSLSVASAQFEKATPIELILKFQMSQYAEAVFLSSFMFSLV